MAEHLPAAVALADQWQAEIMDEARELARSAMPADITLTEDERDLLEAGMGVGYAASLLVLQRNGWLRKPGVA